MPAQTCDYCSEPALLEIQHVRTARWDGVPWLVCVDHAEDSDTMAHILILAKE